MAKIIKGVRTHDCYSELDELPTKGLAPGAEAECSCGKRFALCSNQRNGLYWFGLDVDA